MKILVLGAGAVGGYYGARLMEAGAEVTFLVRPERMAELDANGLQISSPLGDFHRPVTACLAGDTGSDFDIVFLTCKAYSLRDAIGAISPAMAGRAAVLPMLNGVAHLAVLNDRFGSHRVIGGTVKISAALCPGGAIRHLNDWCMMLFGEQNGQQSPRVEALKVLYDRTTVDARISENIRHDIFLKLVHLHTLASMTSLMRANVGEIVRSPEGGELMLRVLDTNVEIARREGFPPDEKFIATFRDLFSQADSAYQSSLLRDIERGGPTEADHILGYMLERCRAHGLPDTIHQLAYTAAKAYEQRRDAGRL